MYVEKNASIHQVHPVSRVTGERRAEILRSSGPEFEQAGSVAGREATQSFREN